MLWPQAAEATRSILEMVKANARRHGSVRLKELSHRLGLREDMLRMRLLETFYQAEVVINFQPDKTLVVAGQQCKSIVAEALVRDPTFRNRFETGVTMSGVPEELRIAWEEANFGVAIHALPASERPKYAGVNWDRNPSGFWGYGDAVLVLRQTNLLDRMTLSPDNTSRTDEYLLGHGEAPENALANNYEILREAGLLNTNPPPAEALGVLDGSLEVQLWGDLPIGPETVERIRLPSGAKGRTMKAVRAVAEMAAALGIPWEYYRT